MTPTRFLERLCGLSDALGQSQALLSGSAGAHAHLAMSTHSVPGEPARYSALVPRSVHVVAPMGSV